MVEVTHFEGSTNPRLSRLSGRFGAYELFDAISIVGIDLSQPDALEKLRALVHKALEVADPEYIEGLHDECRNIEQSITCYELGKEVCRILDEANAEALKKKGDII